MIKLDPSIFDFLHFSNPTEEQKNVLKSLETFVQVDNQYDFFVLRGQAGTGKTSITSALVGYLNTLEIGYKIAAPTGRAARILNRKTKSITSTIHSMIFNPKNNQESGTIEWRLKTTTNVKPMIFIIDESSMIPLKADNSSKLFISEEGLLVNLITYIKKGNVNNKILFLGDVYQLPPIGEETPFALNKEFLETRFNLKGLTFSLNEVKRQKDGSYILENATNIRKAIDQNQKSHPIEGGSNKNIYSARDKYVNNINSNGLEDSIVISVSNNANKLFNDLTRERIFGYSKKILEKGDLLMVVQNWTRNGISLYNGDHVELIEIDWNIQEKIANLHYVPIKLKLLFSENEVIIEDYLNLESIIALGGQVNPMDEKDVRKERYIKNKIFRESNLPSDDRYVGALKLTYGHAITCNKAQGGEWKKVFINTWGIPNLKWQYTAVTRAIDEIEKF
jgi:ATP-dependent exoDNAse (exonuclease V) alpha subunit